MIKLENISINDLYMVVYTKSVRNYEEFDKYYRSLIDIQITDFQQLSDLIDMRHPDFNNEFFINYLSNIKRRIEISNNVKHEPELYISDIYEKSGYDKETIELIKEKDNRIMGNELLYTNPFINASVIGDRLGYFSISQIRYLLEHCVVTGKNAFHSEHNIGIVTVNKVYNAMKMYEEQIIRQLKENNDYIANNIFYYDYSEKLLLVLEQLNDIFEYLIENANECVWGNLTDYQKWEMQYGKLKKYINNPLENTNLTKFVNYIANYTTLSELEKGLVKTKILDRFIKK